MEAWLRMLALSFPPEVYDHCWLRDLRDDWLLQSAGFFSGFVSPQLDQHLSAEDRKTVILETAKRVRSKIESFEETIPAATLELLGLGWHPHSKSLPRSELLSIADRFIELLEGKLTTTAATSPTLPGPWTIEEGQAGS